MITISVLNSLDPDQARRFVGPDLGPNILQKSSADDTSRQMLKALRLGFQKGELLFQSQKKEGSFIYQSPIIL